MKCTNKIINRIALCGIICLTATCLSGCVNVETNLHLDRQGNAVLQEQTLFKQEAINAIQMFESDFSIDNIVSKIENLHNPDITVEKVEQDDSSGLKITKKIRDIEKQDIKFDELLMNDVTKTQLDSGNFVDVNKTFFTTNYNLDFNIDMKKDARNVNFKFNIYIPVKATKHNATSVNPKKHIYTWVIDASAQNLFISYTTLNIANILLSILPILLVLLGLIAVIFMKLKPNIKDILNRSEIVNEEVDEDMIECPYCGELIKKVAKKCRHCGEWSTKETKGDV